VNEAPRVSILPNPLGGDRRQAPSSRLRRWLELLRESRHGVHLKLLLVHILLVPFPPALGLRLRPRLYRQIGFKVGRDVSIFGNISFDGGGDIYSRLTIGDGVIINSHVHININAPVFIGNRVGVGHHSIIITDTHEIGPSHARLGRHSSLPVTIEDGAWVCATATLLPGVTVRKGAVVAAGSVVSRDVPPDTMVVGSPARVKKQLPVEDGTETRASEEK
jgi:maltose O-acetyltransferase